MTLARLWLAVWSLLLLCGPAAAQLPTLAEQLEECRSSLAGYKQGFSRLEGELADIKRYLERYLSIASDVKNDRSLSIEDKQAFARTTRSLIYRMDEVQSQLSGGAEFIKRYERYCDELAERVSLSREARRRSGPGLKGGRRLGDDINNRLIKVGQGIEDIKKRVAEFERRFAIVLPALVWLGPRIEVAAFLGWLVALNHTNLNPFDQELQRRAGLSGGAQILFAWPLADRFDVRFGGTAFFSGSEAERIRNLLVAGSVLVNGHYNTTALLATIGLGTRLFDRWYAAFDVGGGAGLNHLVIRNGTTGATIVDSNDTVFAWMARVSLLYALTEDIRVGLFLAYLGTEAMGANLANGTPFTMGGLRNVVAGITLAYAFGQSSRR